MGLVAFVFFFNDTATTEIYTLSLHDALPISPCRAGAFRGGIRAAAPFGRGLRAGAARDRGADPRPARRRDLDGPPRSEEHTSELQSRQYLVCRLLLEKKKKTTIYVCVD